MGVLFKARDLHLDRFVALKILPAEKVADPNRKRRFVQEAKAASSLNHPNIIHIYDIASEAGVDFIAMEYVVGKTLDERISRRGSPSTTHSGMQSKSLMPGKGPFRGNCSPRFVTLKHHGERR